MVAVVKLVARTASHDKQRVLGTGARQRYRVENEPIFLISGNSSAQHWSAETSNEGKVETQ
ncbi:MAG: hypothetical protein WAS73_19105 [Defluviicoccus sp.]